MKTEDYFFEFSEQHGQSKILVLIIYDIVDNKKRLKLAKLLQGYGRRVQKSAFEAVLTQKKYDKLIRQIPQFVSEEDSIRIYRIQGKSQVISFGNFIDEEEEDIILI